jgi:hypothetical protein
MRPELVKKYFFISAAIAVCFVLLFSGCTLVVSHERESLVRSVESGSSAARLLIQGANFWARYFMFCTIALFSLFWASRQVLIRAVRS